MKILFVFAGQGYHENNLFDIFRTDQKAMSLLKIFSAAAKIDFLRSDLQITNPSSIQCIIGTYQSTLFARLIPLFTDHQVDLIGYSLGEVNAFLASIGASPKESIKLLSYRTQIMTSIVKKNGLEEYDLLSIIGKFTLEEIQTILEKHNCYTAIINSNQHIVIGGKVSDLKKLAKELSKYHLTHAKFLEIHLPSHTPFYADESKLFQEFLNEHWRLDSLRYSIISPLELNKVYNAEKEKVLLSQELYSTIQWHSVCNLISEYQYNLIIDLGPGESMTNILTASNVELSNTQIVTASRYNSLKGLYRTITSFTSSCQ